MPPGTNRLDVNAAAKASLQALATFEYLEPLLQVCKGVSERSTLQKHTRGQGGVTEQMTPAFWRWPAARAGVQLWLRC